MQQDSKKIAREVLVFGVRLRPQWSSILHMNYSGQMLKFKSSKHKIKCKSRIIIHKQSIVYVASFRNKRASPKHQNEKFTGKTETVLLRAKRKMIVYPVYSPYMGIE